jgi:hypothetical protein
MKEIAYERVVTLIYSIETKLKHNKDYSDDLFKMLEIMIKMDVVNDVQDLSFDELFWISFQCFQTLLIESEMRENYEVCSTITNILKNEEEIYKAWVMTLPEEEIEDALDELEHTKQLNNLIRDNNNGYNKTRN